MAGAAPGVAEKLPSHPKDDMLASFRQLEISDSWDRLVELQYHCEGGWVSIGISNQEKGQGIRYKVRTTYPTICMAHGSFSEQLDWVSSTASFELALGMRIVDRAERCCTTRHGIREVGQGAYRPHALLGDGAVGAVAGIHDASLSGSANSLRGRAAARISAID
jgi:hypothetical protein